MNNQLPVRDPEEKTKPQFEQVLGLFSATAIAIAGIIGSGIFFTIGIATRKAGPAVILSLLLDVIVALFTALSFASLGSKITKKGGEYQFVYLAFGKKLASWPGYCGYSQRELVELQRASLLQVT